MTNPEPARGGRAIESIENVLRRGPNEFLTVRRAVTAADFELLAAQSSGAVARARALTRAEVWSFARPGEVEVVARARTSPTRRRTGGRFGARALVDHQTEEAPAGDAGRARPSAARSAPGAWSSGPGTSR